PRGGQKALAGENPEPAKGSGLCRAHTLCLRDKSSEESDAARSFLTSDFHRQRRRPEPVQPENLGLLSGSSHAKSLWSRDVPERRDNLARFQRELFKMTFASSNPPTPASESSLNCAVPALRASFETSSELPPSFRNV